MSKKGSKLVAEVSWVNSSGLEGKAFLEEPDRVSYSWWSSKRGIDGKFKKTDVTIFQELMNKLKDCSKVEVKVYESK